jgi:hypothetical protein
MEAWNKVEQKNTNGSEIFLSARKDEKNESIDDARTRYANTKHVSRRANGTK